MHGRSNLRSFVTLHETGAMQASIIASFNIVFTLIKKRAFLKIEMVITSNWGTLYHVGFQNKIDLTSIM